MNRKQNMRGAAVTFSMNTKTRVNAARMQELRLPSCKYDKTLGMTRSVSMCEMSEGASEQNEQNTGDDDVMEAQTPSRMKDFEKAASSPEARRVAAAL